MDGTNLRIKFTPLLKDIHKDDSKCYLEIVPEISCLQNLDKIEWKQENDSIEYTIPMTYKIILRKHKPISNLKNNVGQMYHSCVDLLHPSSVTNMKLGSGDILKKNSDNSMLNKVTADVDKHRCIVLTRPEIDSWAAESVEQQMSFDQTVHQYDNGCNIERQLSLIDSPSTQTKQSIKEMVVEHKTDEDFSSINTSSNNYSTNYSSEKIFVDKNISQGRSFYSLTQPKEEFIETITHISTMKSKADFRKKLSITPICAINTHQEPLLRTVYTNTVTSIFCRYIEPNRHIFPVRKSSSDFFESCYTINLENLNGSTPVKVMSDNLIRRILPEVRIAQYLKTMEMEMFPLKLMLEDIINKCTTLGLPQQNSRNLCFQDPIIYKGFQQCNKNKSKVFKTEKQLKSNRVVYSIVFDG